ncbi:hypothetical protein [Microcoleus sp. D2_18a_B4]|uniref:hypothetical protein n=1 Tax=Microcoleus sp. D2_18a_B4 TaxID=3055329 RepID=UPI002FCFA906
MINSVQILNSLSSSLELWIPLNLSKEEFELELHRSAVLRTALNDLLQGKLSISDYLEFVEFLNIDIDNYLDKIEENLQSTPVVHLR